MADFTRMNFRPPLPRWIAGLCSRPPALWRGVGRAFTLSAACSAWHFASALGPITPAKCLLFAALIPLSAWRRKTTEPRKAGLSQCAATLARAQFTLSACKPGISGASQMRCRSRCRNGEEPSTTFLLADLSGGGAIRRAQSFRGVARAEAALAKAQAELAALAEK